MNGFVIDIETKTRGNENYREVLFTTDRSQLVVMAIEPGDEIGEEVHEEHDQFIRIEEGSGKVILDGEPIDIGDGSAIVIPAGTMHNVVNTSENEKLRLYTIYTPPEHEPGTIHPRKQDSEE